MRLSVTRTAKICPIEIAANISTCVTGKIAQLHSRPYSPKLQPALPRLLGFPVTQIRPGGPLIWTRPPGDAL